MNSTVTLRSFFSLATLALFSLLFTAVFAQQYSRDDLAEINGERGNQTSTTNIPYFQPAPQTGGNVLSTNNKVNACGAGFIFNSPYNSNNGQRGCMFDITAANSVTIRCFESNLYAGTTANYEIYYAPQTHVGIENNSAAWTFLGGVTGITSAGNNVPTALPININVTIPAGQTYSFYITNDFGGGTSYTDGTAVGNFLAADANLTIYEGVGKSYPFGLTFNVRNFNGHIFYDLGSVLDANNLVLNSQSDAKAIQLEWSKPANSEPLAYQLFRSENGEAFELMHEEMAGETAYTVHDHSVDRGATYFYKLVMIGADGQTMPSNVVETALSQPETARIGTVFPNPFTDHTQLKLILDTPGKVRLSMRDAVGKVLFVDSPGELSGTVLMDIPLEDQPSGLYFLEIVGPYGREVHKLIKN